MLVSRWTRKVAGINLSFRRFVGSVILDARVGAVEVSVWFERRGWVSWRLGAGRIHLEARLRQNYQRRTGGWGPGERPMVEPRHVVWLGLDASWMPEYDQRTHRKWHWSTGIRELIDSRPFGFFLEGAAV